MATNIVAGTVAGTGAAINISIGFVPVMVMVSNYEDADTIDIWHAGMAAGTSLTISTAVATRATNGITLFDGSSTAAVGFTIGSGISESGKDLAYIAFGEGPGQQ